ncbi:MAG: TolC family protein [Myxococcaceae bacterium]|nr:TolC family protein [Myxococcaceae bacterium]
MRALLAVMLLTAGVAQAATLKELLDAADKQNVDRRVSAEQRDRAAAEYRQSVASLFPALSAQGSWTNNQYPASFPNPMNPSQTLTIIAENQLDAQFRFDLPLIDTTRWFRAMASSSLLDSAELREASTRDLVKRQVVSAWYSYAALLAVRESALRSAKVADAQAELQEIRAKAGAATELEMLRARAEAQGRRQYIADTEANIANVRRSLRTLTGVEPGDVATLPEDDIRAAEPLEQLEQNVDQLPQVRAADRDSEAQGRLATAQRLAVLPTVSAQFTERLTNAAGFQGRNALYNAGVVISWRLDAPTFLGMSAATANENIAVLGTERARLVARDQIHGDWQRLNAALHKLEAAKAQQQANERAAQVSRDRYAAGAATQLDVITAERDLLSAEVNQISARTELAAARLSLRISAGQPLQVE